MNKRIGKHTVFLQSKPSIIAGYSVVGPKEGKGPLNCYFDEIKDDVLLGENTWEKAESKFVKDSIQGVLDKAKLQEADINYIISGDLLNQITASSYALKDKDVPFLGVYGACSTMAESLSLASILVDGGYADYIIASTSSHFCSAEKQFRGPLELGNQRPITAQWTVTGAGASIVSSKGKQDDVKITYVTTGVPIDYGVNDANNMGAAMAPAAVFTLTNHFKETYADPNMYDLIVTGDLGHIGSNIVRQLMKKEGFDVDKNYNDCGVLIFDKEMQDTHSGGSGCGCSATVLNGYILRKMKKHELNRVLFVATGALMSPMSLQQGENILGIAHAIVLENLN